MATGVVELLLPLLRMAAIGTPAALLSRDHR